MQRLWLALLLGCFAMPSVAQVGPGCGGGGVSPPCAVTATPSAPTNTASVALSTSAAINAATLATGSAFPNTWGTFYANNPSGTDIAVCRLGGTCTCLANGIAATNGETVSAGVLRYPFNGNGAAVATPTWVSCTGSAVNVGVAW